MKLCCLVGGVQSTWGETLQRHREEPAGRGCGGSRGLPCRGQPSLSANSEDSERSGASRQRPPLISALLSRLVPRHYPVWTGLKLNRRPHWLSRREGTMAAKCRCPLPHAGCGSLCISGAACPHLSFPLHKLKTTNCAIFSAALTATRL